MASKVTQDRKRGMYRRTGNYLEETSRGPPKGVILAFIRKVLQKCNLRKSLCVILKLDLSNTEGLRGYDILFNP
jgi:hypothetical protein